MVGRGGGMMQSLEAVLRRVAGRGESSQMAGGRTRRRRGEASSSVPPLDEDAGTSQTTRSGRSSRRTRGPRARSPSPEDEEEPPQQQEEQDQEQDQQQQEQDQEEEERPLVRRTMTREGWQETYLPSGCEAPLVSRTDLYRSSKGRLFGWTVKGK